MTATVGFFVIPTEIPNRINYNKLTNVSFDMTSNKRSLLQHYKCKLPAGSADTLGLVFMSAVLDAEGSSFNHNCVKCNEHRPILSVGKCRPITLDSGNVRYDVSRGHCIPR